MAEKITLQALREAVSFSLRLRVRGTVTAYTAGTPATITIAEVGALLSQAQAPISSYVVKTDGTKLARVTDYAADTSVLTLQTSAAGAFTAGDFVDIYHILTPEEWNEGVREGLSEQYTVERFYVSPVADQSEYSLPEWLSRVEDVKEVFYRYVNENRVHEESWAAWKVVRSGNSLVLQFFVLPASLTGVTFAVEAQRSYKPLMGDQDATTCPARLAKAATKLKALEKIWSLMGEASAKEMFGTEMALALAEYSAARLDKLPRVTPQSLKPSQPYTGPEMAWTPGEGKW